MKPIRVVLALVALLAVAPRLAAQTVRTVPSVQTATLAGWTSATALNSTQTIFGPGDAGFDSVVVQLTQGSTITGGAITFEVSFDNTTWITIPADAVLDPTSTSYAQIALPYTLVASTNKYFLVLGKGFQGLRLKLSTAITGTATVTPNVTYVPGETVGRVISQPLADTPVLGNGLSTTPLTVSAGAAVLNSYFCLNPNTSTTYIQIFDISGTVTLGTSTPKWSIGIPAGTGNPGAGNLSQMNLNFANAIKVAATTTATGSTAPSTALDCNFGVR
jgi:hypothetical protein